MLVNHFKFRTDIESYNLGGMGCGNGVMGLSLIKHLLLVRACMCNSTAPLLPDAPARLVVATRRPHASPRVARRHAPT